MRKNIRNYPLAVFNFPAANYLNYKFSVQFGSAVTTKKSQKES